MVGGVDTATIMATINYLNMNKKTPTKPDGYVVLPDNSIEVKAGWRVLNSNEAKSGHFHTATVRYYENSNSGVCYHQATFGLVALHIIQKTPMAPDFIYATFEQAENILDAGGHPIEDENGKVVGSQPCRSGQAAPCPTTPSVTLNDTPTVNAQTYVPPQVVRAPENASYCTSSTSETPPNRLFYLNTSYLAGLPTGGYICVNKRDNDIPPVIQDVNKAAHALISANSVWQHYKLVNVQYQPVDKDHAALYGTQPGENDFTRANNPSTYYLANIVVETNRSLQLFSGGLVDGGGTGASSDYASQSNAGTGIHATTFYTGIHATTFYNGKGYNQGGCMGCHGVQGQQAGGDFSVILARGPVLRPEPPAQPTSQGVERIPRNRSLK